MKKNFLILALSLIFLSFILNMQHVNALASDSTCRKLEIVFARGSGRNIDNKESTQFESQLDIRLKDNTSYHYYELGKEQYNNHQYPAVDIGVWNGNALGAFTSGGKGNDYGKSVREGVLELQSYISQRYQKCKSSGMYFILGGYSQGAQVIGEALAGIPKEIRDRIVFTGLFGDPKLYLPEGTGGTWWNPPPACQGKNLSLYRRTIGDCSLSEGRLGARKPIYLSDDMKSKTGLWCYSDDFVCGTSPNPYAPGHNTYSNKGGAIDTAAQEAATRLLHALSREPRPTPLPDNLIDITHKYGDRLNGQDVVFLVDLSYEMRGNVPQVEQYLKRSMAQIEAAGNRATLFRYYSTPLYNGIETKIVNATSGQPFGYINYLMAIQLYYTNPYSLPDAMLASSLYRGSVLDSLMVTMNGINNWNNGANKSIIIISNSPDLNGAASSTSATLAQVIDKSLRIDPVNVYAVVPTEYTSTYQQLADLTSGQVIPYISDIGQAGDIALDKILTRPVALLNNSSYSANPGQEITFDASDSYVVGGTITKYEWDFDGDGSFETTTTDPTINHTYANTFDGYVQVRITSSDGIYANASAPVKIGTATPPVLPSAPTNLTATVVDSNDNTDTVRLTWQPPANNPLAYSLTVNGVMLGMLTPDRTSIDITDVDRSDDVDFGIAGIGSGPTGIVIGSAAVTTLFKPQPPTPDPVTEPETVTKTNTDISSAKTPLIKTVSSSLPLTFAAMDTTDVLGAQQTEYSDTNIDVTPSDDKHLMNTATVPIASKSHPAINIPWYLPVTLALLAGGLAAWAIRRFTRH